MPRTGARSAARRPRWTLGRASLAQSRHPGSPRASILDKTLAAQLAQERAHFVPDGPGVAVAALNDTHRDLVLVAPCRDFAHDGGGRRVQRKDLFRLGLEQDTAEFLLPELNVLRKLHFVRLQIRRRALTRRRKRARSRRVASIQRLRRA